MKPYYEDGTITLYQGDMREILPAIGLQFDACITDPPYEETRIEWDRWPDGWPSIVGEFTSSLWCWGSARLFMDKKDEFAGWKFAQDIVWEKQNGSSLHADRFRRVHEVAFHFYRGPWSAIYKNPADTENPHRRPVRRTTKPEHWGQVAAQNAVSDGDGDRLMRSVIRAKSAHPHALHPTQKPQKVLGAMIQYSVPRGGVMLDCFAGSGESLITAKKLGTRSVGIELQKEYCDLIVDRLAQLPLLESAE